MSPTEADGTGDARVGLTVVWFLAALAGAVDACGLSLLKDLFVSFMSGNTTSLGVALAQGDWARAGLIGGILASFVAGAAGGAIIAHAVGRYHLPVVVLAVAVILTVPRVARPLAVPAVTFAMGVLNAAMQHAGPVNVSITYVTGTLVKLGQGLGLLACGQAGKFAWLEQAVPWTGLLAGAAAASLALARYGEPMFVGLPLMALLVASGCWVTVKRAATGTAE